MVQENRYKIILIGASDFSLESLQYLPVDIILFDVHPPKLRENIFHYFNLPDDSNEYLSKKIVHIYHKFNCKCVITFYEQYLDLLTTVLEDPKLTSVSSKAIINTRNKIYFRQILDKKKLNNVPFRPINSVDDIVLFLQEVKSEIIVKPTKGFGSKGILKLHPDDTIVLDSILYEKWVYDDEFRFIAEKYIKGDEYSVETISHQGKHEIIGIVKRQPERDNFFVSSGHISPTNMTEEFIFKVKNSICKMLDAIELKEGAAHTELKYTNDSIYIIEAQVRTGGANIWKLIKSTTGCEMRLKVIANLLQIDIPNQEKDYQYAYIRCIHSPKGILKEFVDPDNILKHANIIDTHFKFKTGDFMPEITCSENRRGFIVVGANSIQGLIEIKKMTDHFYLETINE